MSSEKLPYSATYQADLRLLRSVEMGSEVVLYRNHVGEVAEVEDATKEHIVVAGTRFSRESGWPPDQRGGRLYVTGLTTHSAKRV